MQEQPFQVLAALLDQPGEVITREDLTRRLWPDGTFLVEPTDEDLRNHLTQREAESDTLDR